MRFRCLISARNIQQTSLPDAPFKGSRLYCEICQRKLSMLLWRVDSRRAFQSLEDEWSWAGASVAVGVASALLRTHEVGPRRPWRMANLVSSPPARLALCLARREHFCVDAFRGMTPDLLVLLRGGFSPIGGWVPALPAADRTCRTSTFTSIQSQLVPTSGRV